MRYVYLCVHKLGLLSERAKSSGRICTSPTGKMNYQDTIDYLFNIAPLFQQVGASAYKPGLSNTLTLDEHFGHPHQRYRTIHVAGTNGKGSCAHLLAAVLMESGYRTGLYTSPHLVDFRERIRVDGQPCGKQFVVDFIDRERPFFEPLHPSFFELTTAMAFEYFAEQQVDVAVIEVGLGGRLDCTNIICPDLSVITNISFDHVRFLGHTLSAIAAEKAGIIKPRTPVVVGEYTDETRPVFERRASELSAPLVFAQDRERGAFGLTGDELECELGGLYQERNKHTVLTATDELLTRQAYHIDESSLRRGFAHVCRLTGLRGRWQQLGDKPCMVCDTGHNPGGMAYIARQLREQTCRKLRIVIGVVNDKDVSSMLALLPHDAEYYFTRPSVHRALPVEELMRYAESAGLHGRCLPDVPSAVHAALAESSPDDFVFVGGSSYVVADLLSEMDRANA